MELEGAKAELRSRSPYEAADLGLRLLRALSRPALWAWLSFVLPVQLCVLVACAPFPVAWSVLAVWWLKPVYDRAWGLVLGRGLFGDAPTGWALYHHLWRDGRRGLLGDLLWRRLDPTRTLVASVALLEGLSGHAATRRRQLLGEGTTHHAGLVLAACFAIELATTAGWVVGAISLVPQGVAGIAEELGPLASEALSPRLILACYVLAMSMVEPLFVASGFGLYVNRRTNLEGWDVELSFRRMSRRLAAKAAAGAALLLTCSALPSLWSSASAAQDDASAERADAPEEVVTRSAVDDSLRLPAPELIPDAGAAQAMARVLARPELRRSHVEEHWQLRRWRENEPAVDSRWPWLESLVNAVATGFELALWAVATLALAVFVYLIAWRRARRTGDRLSESLATPAALVQPDAAPPRGLPPRDVVSKARTLLAQGDEVTALAVLYAGTLAALLEQNRIVLPPQATEGQCLAAVRGAPIAEERRTLFMELTAVWESSAYAHVRPERRRLEDICARFAACFGGAP